MNASSTPLRAPARLARISDLSTVSTTDLKNQIGTFLERADSEVIAVTRHKRPKYVVLPAAVYENIVQNQDVSLASLNEDFDVMVARMNTAQAAKAYDALFDATPGDLGQAAAKASSVDG